MSDCAVRWFADESECECHRSVAVCSECIRALALKWWGGIARHGFGVTTPCLLCGHGEATYCADHALAAVLRQREALVLGGATLGEPEWSVSGTRVTEPPLERENAILRSIADAADRIMAQLELADDPVWDGNEDYDRLAAALASRAADSDPRSDA